MAIPNWITVTPTSGTGDTNVTITTSSYKGRTESRLYQLTATTTSGLSDSILIKLKPYGNYLSVSRPSGSLALPPSIKEYAVTIHSNGTVFSVSALDPALSDMALKNGTIIIIDSNGNLYEYTLQGDLSTGAFVKLDLDYGKSDVYRINFIVSFTENVTSGSLNRGIKVETVLGEYLTIDVTQDN